MAHISYQLYSSRNFLPLENIFKMVAQHGCTQVEGVSFFMLADTAQATKNRIAHTQQLLTQYALTMPSVHIGIADLQHRCDDVIYMAKALGCKTVFIAYVAPKDRPTTAEGWRQLACQVQHYAQPVLNAGIQVGWHNHDFEFTEVDGSYPLAEIVTGFPQIKLEIDVAWVVLANQDPHDILKQYGDRIVAIHIKDIAPAGQNTDQDGWCHVGEGIIDWQSILKTAKEYTQTQLFVLEHDNPANDAEFTCVSVKNVQQMFKNIGL